MKRKNPINEALFVGPSDDHALNPYARIIVDEARRRGIQTDIIDSEGGLFRLSWGGRSVRCRESLSELTSAVALSICDDKRVTRRIVDAAESEFGGINIFGLVQKLICIAPEMHGKLIDCQHLHDAPRTVLVLRGVKTANLYGVLVFRHRCASFS